MDGWRRPMSGLDFHASLIGKKTVSLDEHLLQLIT